MKTAQDIATERKVITECRTAGHHVEALVRLHLLNVDTLRSLLKAADPKSDAGSMKPRQLAKALGAKSVNPKTHAALMKPVRRWLAAMAETLKSLKKEMPHATGDLLDEGERIFELLYAALKQSARKKSRARLPTRSPAKRTKATI